MRTSKLLALAVSGAVLAAPAAFAQDAPSRFSDIWSYGTDSGQFAVVGSFSHSSPRSSSGEFAGARSEIGGGNAATASFSWFYNDHLALELWGGLDRFTHDVDLDGVKTATLDSQPVALSLQYHHTFNDTFRPFVGIGYQETNYSREEGVGALQGSNLGLRDGTGAIGTVGVDLLAGDTWFVRTDARYLRARSTLEVDGTPVGRASVDPWIYSVGIGARF